jgi:phosphoribosyl-AMP cyclohydrolase
MKLEIDFDKMQGLAPAIVQDAQSGEVLMLGFLNNEAWQRTISSGYVTFFSRTRSRLWTKGETSGNLLKLVTASTDCDRDTLLLEVEVQGAGVVCHKGTRSCFNKRFLLRDPPHDDLAHHDPTQKDAEQDVQEKKRSIPAVRW